MCPTAWPNFISSRQCKLRIPRPEAHAGKDAHIGLGGLMSEASVLPYQKIMAVVGFEPTPPERLEPKSSALDRSATLPGVSNSSEPSMRKLEWRAKPAGYNGRGGVETHACEETGASIQRLRPLGHATVRYTKALSRRVSNCIGENLQSRSDARTRQKAKANILPLPGQRRSGHVSGIGHIGTLGT